MPHDANGDILHVGDIVLIPAIVTQIMQTEEYCNCTVKTVHRMPGSNEVTTFSALNTRQVEKK